MHKNEIYARRPAFKRATLQSHGCPMQMSASGRSACLCQDPDGEGIEVNQGDRFWLYFLKAELSHDCQTLKKKASAKRLLIYSLVERIAKTKLALPF
jgi:hypothetical protein